MGITYLEVPVCRAVKNSIRSIKMKWLLVFHYGNTKRLRQKESNITIQVLGNIKVTLELVHW